MLKGRLRVAEGGRVAFWCPGCAEPHMIAVGPGEGPRWSFDGDYDRPTFSPSVLVRSGHYADGRAPWAECWCTFEARFGSPPAFKCVICHSFVRNGRIEFLSDSTHGLAGQTVVLPEFPGQ